eukprot:gene5399-5414_t
MTALPDPKRPNTSVAMVSVLSKVPGIVDALKAATRTSARVDFTQITPEDVAGIPPGAEYLVCDPGLLAPKIGSLPASVRWVHSTWAGPDVLIRCMLVLFLSMLPTPWCTLRISLAISSAMSFWHVHGGHPRAGRWQGRPASLGPASGPCDVDPEPRFDAYTDGRMGRGPDHRQVLPAMASSPIPHGASLLVPSHSHPEPPMVAPSWATAHVQRLACPRERNQLVAAEQQSSRTWQPATLNKFRKLSVLTLPPLPPAIALPAPTDGGCGGVQTPRTRYLTALGMCVRVVRKNKAVVPDFLPADTGKGYPSPSKLCLTGHAPLPHSCSLTLCAQMDMQQQHLPLYAIWHMHTYTP